MTRRSFWVWALPILGLAALGWQIHAITISEAGSYYLFPVVALLFILWLRFLLGKKKELPPEDRHALYKGRDVYSVPAPATLVIGAVISTIIAFSLKLAFDVSWEIAAVLGILVFLIGFERTPANHSAIITWIGDFRFKKFFITEGPGWLPWFLGVIPFAGEVPDQPREVTPGRVFMGLRNLRREELSENGMAPSVPARDKINTAAPLSGTYETVDPVIWQRNEHPESILVGKILETLRLTAAKFNFNDLLSMKSVVNGLVSGKTIVLVARIQKVGEKGLLQDGVICDRHLNRYFETVNMTSSKKDNERAVEDAKEKLAKRIMSDAGARNFLDDDIDTVDKLLPHIEDIYVADGLLRDSWLIGAAVRSLQIIDIRPVDDRIFEAAAQIEIEMLERRGELIQAETRVQIAAQLAAKLGISRERAAQLARIDAGASQEFIIDSKGGGSGDSGIAALAAASLNNTRNDNRQQGE